MPFYKNFEMFDPLLGYVPDYPFSSLPDVAAKARSLLANKTSEQITEAAIKISKEIDCYFDDELVFAKMSHPDEQDEPLDVPNESNTSEVDAFKAIVEKHEDGGFFSGIEPEPFAFPEGSKFELFAALALWMTAESIEWSDRSVPLAGEYALRAMLAVHEAESAKAAAQILPAAGKLREDVRSFIKRVELEIQAHDSTRTQLKDLLNNFETSVCDEAQKRLSALARKAAGAAHKENRAMRNEAMSYYEAHKNELGSKDAAAEAIAGKIVPARFRTVRRWITEHDKSLLSARKE